jgi:hypothetical protein
MSLCGYIGILLCRLSGHTGRCYRCGRRLDVRFEQRGTTMPVVRAPGRRSVEPSPVQPPADQRQNTDSTGARTPTAATPTYTSARSAAGKSSPRQSSGSLREVLVDPASDEQEDVPAWLGLDKETDLDPHRFELNGVSRALSAGASPT